MIFGVIFIQTDELDNEFGQLYISQGPVQLHDMALLPAGWVSSVERGEVCTRYNSIIQIQLFWL